MDLSANALVECNNLTSLSKLKRLWLDNNLLCDIVFKGLLSLEYLSLSQNRIEHLNDMSDLKKLVYLDLSGNRLTGLIILYIDICLIFLQGILGNSVN